MATPMSVDPWRVLTQRFDRAVNPFVPAGAVALLDFPNHPNVGDSAIWLGEMAWLSRRSDCPVRYVADYETFSAGALRQAMPHGTVLLHGGGNFGDVWPMLQECRNRYLAELRDYRMVQLPQSLHFANRQSATVAARRCAEHPDFTILVRSKRSLDLAGDIGFPRVELAPDAAFLLGKLVAPRSSKPCMVLSRTDRESSHALQVEGVESTDWLTDTWPVSHWRVHALGQRAFRAAGSIGREIGPRWANWLAANRLRRGLRLIALGRIVVTNRLHACILGVLIGRKVIALDNNYGKLRAVLDTWMPDHPAISWVEHSGELRAAVSRELDSEHSGANGSCRATPA